MRAMRQIQVIGLVDDLLYEADGKLYSMRITEEMLRERLGRIEECTEDYAPTSEWSSHATRTTYVETYPTLSECTRVNLQTLAECYHCWHGKRVKPCQIESLACYYPDLHKYLLT